jgi:hypothetical protein
MHHINQERQNLGKNQGDGFDEKGCSRFLRKVETIVLRSQGEKN